MSPLHEPPSYNQAMKGAGLAGGSGGGGGRALSPPHDIRIRSLSESVAMSSGSRGGVAVQPLSSSTAVAKDDPKAKTVVVPSMSVESTTMTVESAATSDADFSFSSSTGTTSVAGGRGGVAGVKLVKGGSESAKSGGSESVKGTSGSGAVAGATSSDPHVEVLVSPDATEDPTIAQGSSSHSSGEQNETFMEPIGGGGASEGHDRSEFTKIPEGVDEDFARHVRGTSTPIDDGGATPNQSHTFVTEEERGVVVDSSEPKLEVKRSSLRREDAMEVATPSPDPTPGEGEGQRKGSTP